MPKYDIACIGAGISGLASAALLAKAGKSVCLIDPANHAGGCVAAQELGGFRYMAGPPITYGFEPGGILHKLYTDLDLPVNAAGQCSGYQVVMPDHRISVSCDPRETLEELCREFPDERIGLTKLYREARNLSERSSKSRLSSYVHSKRSAATYLQTFRFSKNVRSYFDVQSRFFFGHTLRYMPLASLVLMLTNAPRYILGGFAGIADQFLSIIQRQGAGVWYHTEPFPELLVRSNRIIRINLSREHIDPRTVIINFPGDHAESILLLGIREEVIPVGMFTVALCIAEDEYAGYYYSLFLSPVNDLTAAPKGMRTLIAALPFAPAQNQHVGSLMSRISSVIPFLQEFQVHSSMIDTDARRYPLPQTVTVKPSESRFGRLMPAHCSVRNLKIIPDSVRAILPALNTARTLAAELD